MKDFKENQYETGLPSVPSDTSEAAATSMEPVAETLRRKVYDYILRRVTATCDEVEIALDMRHQTASARLRELVLAGFIFDTGVRRLTRSNRSARVYEVVTNDSAI